MGKIGLPLAVHYARGGYAVVGVDVNPRVVALINEGVEPFPGEAHGGGHGLVRGQAALIDTDDARLREKRG